LSFSTERDHRCPKGCLREPIHWLSAGSNRARSLTSELRLSSWEYKYHVHWGDLILRVLDCIMTISFGCILYCGRFNLFCNVWLCVCMYGFCNMWMCVCVGFVVRGCFGNTCACIYCVLYCVYCVCVCFFCISVYVYILFVLSVLV